MTQTPDILAAIGPVAAAFDTMRIAYYITGSIAASVHGLARTSLDVDMVAKLKPADTGALAARLKDAYYLDESAMREAVRGGASFNLIHLETMMKVDVFAPKAAPFAASAFGRRQRHVLDETRTDEFFVASAEDVVLSKLDWYARTGESSQRQWLDVVGVLKVQEGSLDFDYMRQWAAQLGVPDLLGRATKEAGQ